jgi:hypothetical protein
MQRLAAGRLSLFAACAAFVMLPMVSGCGSPAAPTPTLQTENFNGTLQPLGFDFKTFTINFTQGTTDLSVTINSLTTVNAATPVTGITLGIGIGSVSGASCAMQVQTPVASIGQELFAPNGASAGTYCVQIFDCPTGATGCSSTLTEAVNYAVTVKHY